jgi:hypothetical protein
MIWETLVRGILLLVLLLSACARVTPMHGSDGGLMYLVGCYGALTPMSACYDKAAELCPSGYKIIDQTEGVTQYRTSQGAVDSLDRQIAIQCEAEASAAGF